MTASSHALVNPEILRWARESINLSVADAARRIGVQPSRLAAWETGDRRPTIAQARSAARAYRRPLGAFYLAQPPATAPLPRDFRRLPGEEGLPASPELVVAIRRARLRRRVALELEPEQAVAPNWMGTLRASEDPERAGRQVRQSLQLELGTQRSWPDAYAALNGWRQAMEQAGILVFHFSRVDVGEARAFSIAEIPYPVIALNGADTPNGRIFSLLHEVAHLGLGESAACEMRESAPVPSPDLDIEIFCNGTAASALVPAGDLRRHWLVEQHGPHPEWADLELREIARAFRVSQEVILRRLLILDLTTNDFYAAKRAELQARPIPGGGGPIPQARLVLRDAGQRFTRIVLDAYGREAITGNDVAEYLGTRLKHLPRIEELIEGRNTLTGSDR